MAFSDTCPLCHQAARYHPVGGWRRRHYLCPDCSEFVIDSHAVDRIRQLPAAHRSKLAADVRMTPEDHLYVISVTRTQEGHEVQGEAQPLDQALLRS